MRTRGAISQQRDRHGTVETTNWIEASISISTPRAWASIKALYCERRTFFSAPTLYYIKASSLFSESNSLPHHYHRPVVWTLEPVEFASSRSLLFGCKTRGYELRRGLTLVAFTSCFRILQVVFFGIREAWSPCSTCESFPCQLRRSRRMCSHQPPYQHRSDTRRRDRLLHCLLHLRRKREEDIDIGI